MTISVIMSTYHKESPVYLDAALQSIWTDQLRKPEQIVLVEDGPLTDELDIVIDKWHGIIGNCLYIIKKDKNEGLANALNCAIEVSTGDLLARMDSDDVCTPNRFLVQEKYMEEHPEVDILGGALREFNDEGTLDNVRIYPATMAEVKSTMHRMSPLGHPSVMFRRSFFEAGFRYSSKYHICEDVTLWFDAVCAGRIINNIPDVVLNFRRNDFMMRRRSQEKALSEFMAYNDGIHRLHGIFTFKYIYSFIRLLFRLLPVSFVQRVYRFGNLRNTMSNSKEQSVLTGIIRDITENKNKDVKAQESSDYEKKDIKISLITVTFNSAATLRTTFESIMAQKFKNIEYIVVDGASQDGTVELIHQYDSRFEGRMKWVSEPDRGLYDALNKGIRMATGDVVGILNSDDFFTSDDVLSTVVDEIQDVDAVYADIHFVKPNDLKRCVRYYSSRNFRPWAMRFGYMPAHPSFYARREVFDKYGLYSLDYKLAADYDMMVRLFCKYKIKAKYICKDFVTMRTGGMSTNNLRNRLLLTREDAKACKAYGIYSNFMLCSVKYMTKIFEFI